MQFLLYFEFSSLLCSQFTSLPAFVCFSALASNWILMCLSPAPRQCISTLCVSSLNVAFSVSFPCWYPSWCFYLILLFLPFLELIYYTFVTPLLYQLCFEHFLDHPPYILQLISKLATLHARQSPGRGLHCSGCQQTHLKVADSVSKVNLATKAASWLLLIL